MRKKHRRVIGMKGETTKMGRGGESQSRELMEEREQKRKKG